MIQDLSGWVGWARNTHIRKSSELDLMTKLAQPLPLGRQLTDIRRAAGLSRLALAELAGCDRATVTKLEAGDGTLASLALVAGAIGHYVTPYPTALANRRRWQSMGTRSLAAAAKISRPTLQSFEASGAGRVSTLEAVANALGVPARLVKKEDPWTTPRPLIDAILAGLGIEEFCLDAASPDPPHVPCAKFYTEKDDALVLPWHGEHVFCNPPYGQLFGWSDKMLDEVRSGRAKRLVAIQPCVSHTSGWWRTVRSGATNFVLARRPKFGGRDHVLPFRTMLTVWGLSEVELARLTAALPENHRIEAAAEGAAAARHPNA